MQYDVDTPKGYLEALEDDWRKQTLLEIRDVILAQDSEMQEGIEYKMLSYSLNGRSLINLNAQKGYVSVYAGEAAKIDPSGELLKGLNVGKVCVRFSKTKNVSNTRITEYIQRVIELAKSGVEFSC